MGRTSILSRKKFQLFFGLFLFFGVGISIFTFLQSQSSKYQNEEQTGSAFFVIREIPEGTQITDVFSLGFVESRQVLIESLPPQAFSSAASANDPNLFSQRTISTGQLLLASDFGPIQVSTSGLSIPEGSVAISIRLGDVDRLSPFLRPGNEVAIFATGKATRGEGTISKAIIPKAQVLGIGDSRFIGGQGYVPSGDLSIVTLAINENEAGTFILASKTYSLYLALLNRNSSVPVGIVTNEDITN